MKPIPGYEGNYLIGTDGKIFSLKRNKLISLRPNKDGHLRCELSKNGVKRYYFVHRLVGLTYIPNPSNLPFINHKNLIKFDNRVDNLEWVTAKENTNHAVKLKGTWVLKGEHNPMAKLKKCDVLNIKDLISKGFKQKDIARMYKVSRAAICLINKNKNWKNIDGNN